MSAAYSPTNLGSALLLWLDGQDTAALLSGPGGSVVANGANVGRWSDKSGTARHADQGTGAAQPTRGDTALNGHRGLALAGAQGLVVPTLGALGAFEIWLVASSAAATAVIAESYTGAAVTYFAINYDGYGYVCAVSGVSATLSVSSAANTPALVRVVVDTSLASGAVILDVNGTQAVSGLNSSVGVTVAADPLYLGQRYNGTFGVNGAMGEVVATNRVLTAGEATALRTYLQGRWGTP